MSQFCDPCPGGFNDQFANGRLLTVTDRLLPSALRELRADFSKRPVIIGILSLGLILGISGPFNTIDVMPAAPRVVYWLAVVALTFGAGSFVSTIVHRALDQRFGWITYGISALAIGLVVNVVLGLMNLLAFGFWFDTSSAFFNQLMIVTLISGVVEFSSLALRSGTAADTTPNGTTATVPLLDRLTFEKRGAIIALSAEDHYVRIATTKGTELVLMRLSDAVKEVGETPGLRIHRSHWIAVGHVDEVTRIGDRAEVKSSDGMTRPISRGYMNAARDAGLFPVKKSG